MKDTREAIKMGKLKELAIKDLDGLKVVMGRAQIGLQSFLVTPIFQL